MSGVPGVCRIRCHGLAALWVPSCVPVGRQGGDMGVGNATLRMQGWECSAGNAEMGKQQGRE